MRSGVRIACFYMHAQRAVPGILMPRNIKIEWYALYESLLTYIAHLDLVGDPLQGTCHAHASKILY